MKKTIVVLAILGALAVCSAPARAGAISQPTLLEEKAEKGQMFKGKIEAVDADAKTLTVDGAAIVVTDATKITKNGKDAKLADLKVGDEVHGKSRKNSDGKTEAVSIKVGGEKKE